MSHQTLCIRCSIRLAEMMKDQKAEMIELKYETISHEGRCYLNATFSSASNEEHACDDLVSHLFMNEDEIFFQNDEAIYAEETVGNGDTRRRLTFIGKQSETKGLDAANLVN